MACNKKIYNRLKRSEGQMRGIINMMEEEKSCQELIVQLSAVRSSIDKVMGLMVVENLLQVLGDEHQNRLDNDEQLRQAVDLLVRTR